MKTSKVVTSIVAGAAVGALIGVLYAPDKGTSTRKKIMQKGSGYKQSLKNQVDHLVGAVTGPFHAASKEVNGQVDHIGSKLKQIQK